MYQASVPRMAKLLENLSKILDRAQAHLDAQRVDVSTLMDYRLAPDMFPFSKQVQIACNKAIGVVTHLVGMDVPSYDDDEKTLAELKARIARTVAFIRRVSPEQIDGTEYKEISLQVAGKETRYNGMQFLLDYSMPNMYFHATTAYNILRQNGIEIGKGDFLGNA